MVVSIKFLCTSPHIGCEFIKWLRVRLTVWLPPFPWMCTRCYSVTWYLATLLSGSSCYIGREEERPKEWAWESSKMFNICFVLFVCLLFYLVLFFEWIWMKSLLIHSFTNSFINLSTQWFIHSLIYSPLTNSYIHLFIHSFNHSLFCLIHSFTNLIIHLLMGLFVFSFLSTLVPSWIS